MHWGLFKNASTQGFANFGTYAGGILTPFFTLVSALFLGVQILETSKSNKLERLVRDHKEYLALFSDRLKEINKNDIDFYKSNNQLIESFFIVSGTLSQIAKIDSHQFHSSRGLTLSKADRDIVARIERLAFFLNVERGYTKVEGYDWLCKESFSMVEN